MRRWARRFDIAELDKLIVPVHVRSNHWCLAVLWYLWASSGCSITTRLVAVLNRLFDYLGGGKREAGLETWHLVWPLVAFAAEPGARGSQSQATATGHRP